jgi:hypothetical protein
MAVKAKPGRPKKVIVAPKALTKPTKNLKDEKDKPDPLDDLQSLRLYSVEQPTDEDVELITRLAGHQLTADEICACLDISRSRFDGSLSLQAAFQRGQEVGKASLRRMQWVSAKKGNTIMQIFLGKNILGQKDLIETKKDDGGLDADRKSFEDKLKSIIDVTPTGEADGASKPEGTGNCQLLLEAVGEGQPDRSPEVNVVES